MGADEWILRCAWLVNPGQTPRADVRISVVDGVVQEIGPVPNDERNRIQPVAVLPQFVNVHTHLEFSLHRQPVKPALPFTDWISAVVADRRRQSQQQTETAVISGLRESEQAGVGVIGEICTSDAGRTAVQKADYSGQVIAFRELLSFNRDGLDDQLQIAVRHLEQTSPSVRPALSPHAPYSVHPDLFAAAVDLARNQGCCVAMHLAETKSELELLDRQSGEFVDFLQRLKLWNDRTLKPGTTIFSYLQKLAQAPAALAIHGNYFGPQEVKFLLKNPQVATVYCPRTHRYFRHSTHPWQQLRAGGGTVLLGTDSRASNPDLSIWRELQLLSRESATPIWQLLPMITTDARRHVGGDATAAVIRVASPLAAVAMGCSADDELALNSRLCRAECQPRAVVAADWVD